MRKIIFGTLLLMLFATCNSVKNRHNNVLSKTNELSEYELKLVDSILQRGLDNEALYTLLGSLKPMSTLATFTFPIANTDSVKKVNGQVLNRETHALYLERIETIQRAINKLAIPDLEFIMVPYVSAKGNRRIIQLSVVRVSALNKLLKEKDYFYGQFGLVPGADPVVVVTAIESSDKLERWRGYGYLFGYPDYAVDFFNEAGIASEKEGKTIERKYFRIPTFNPKYSNYAYAYPKEYTPSAETDSVLYLKAADVLDTYKSIRTEYLKPDSTVQSYNLLKKYYLEIK